MNRDPRFAELDTAIEGTPIELDEPRPDRRYTITSDEIVEHSSRESFTRAVSRKRQPGDIEPAAIPEGISAAVARAGLRAAYGNPLLAGRCGDAQRFTRLVSREVPR